MKYSRKMQRREKYILERFEPVVDWYYDRHETLVGNLVGIHDNIARQDCPEYKVATAYNIAYSPALKMNYIDEILRTRVNNIISFVRYFSDMCDGSSARNAIKALQDFIIIAGDRNMSTEFAKWIYIEQCKLYTLLQDVKYPTDALPDNIKPKDIGARTRFELVNNVNKCQQELEKTLYALLENPALPRDIVYDYINKITFDSMCTATERALANPMTSRRKLALSAIFGGGKKFRNMGWRELKQR